MAGFFKAKNTETDGVEFWHNPEREGWLMKQGKQQCDNWQVRQLPDGYKHISLTLQESTSKLGGAGN